MLASSFVILSPLATVGQKPLGKKLPPAVLLRLFFDIIYQSFRVGVVLATISERTGEVKLLSLPEAKLPTIKL